MTSQIEDFWRPRWYYKLRNKTTGKGYTGQTVRRNMDSYCGSGGYWKAHCRKYGGLDRNNIEVVSQQWITSKEEAQAWLDQFELENPCYYLSSNTDWANEIRETTSDSTGAGMKGLTKETNEGIARTAAKLTGKNKGLTKETHEGLARMAATLTGRTRETHEGLARSGDKRKGRTKETCPGLASASAKLKGRTKETDPGYAALSAKLTGRTMQTHDYLRRSAEARSKRIRCIELNLVFPSIGHCASFLFLLDDSRPVENAYRQLLNRYLAGRRKKPISGYTFRYVA
jgi:hypothetical protein